MKRMKLRLLCMERMNGLYPHMMCTYGDVNCMHKKSVGKKPIVVAGGKYYAYLMNSLFYASLCISPNTL